MLCSTVTRPGNTVSSGNVSHVGREMIVPRLLSSVRTLNVAAGKVKTTA